MLTGEDPFGGGLKTCSYSAAFMAENAETLVPQGLTEAQFSGAQAKGQLGTAWAKIGKGEIAEGAKIAESLPDEQGRFWTLVAGPDHVIAKKYTKFGFSNQYKVTNPDSGFLQDLMDEFKWKFGSASTPTVSAEKVVEAAKVVSTGPVTPAKLHKVLDAAGFKKSHQTKLKTTHTGAVYGGGVKDTTGYVVQKKVSGDGYEILCKSMTQAQKQQLMDALEAAGYKTENKFGNFIDVQPGSVTQKVEQVAKEIPPTPTASAGAMSDEDVSALFVLIKDKLAKEKGLNIKGANPALDQEVFAEIGSRIGYTAQQVSDKVDAYKATGKKLSALKKKVLKDKPKIPPKPKPATVPDEVLQEKAAADDFAGYGQSQYETYTALIEEQGAEGLQFVKDIAEGKKNFGSDSDKFVKAAQKALHDKGFNFKVPAAAVPEPEINHALLDGFKGMIDQDPATEVPWLKQIASGYDSVGKPVEEKYSLAAKQALKDKGYDWSDAPNGVPTQATKDIVDDVVDDMSEKGLMHGHYTDQDLAAQYIMAKDQVVADSAGKWTLYTQNNAEFDDAIYAMIKDVTGLERSRVEQGVKNYLASGKKLSVLKKQLIKQGTMKKAAPTLKSGTKATKANVDSFASKGFEPSGYKPISLSDAQKQTLYQEFKQQTGTYLTSPESSIYEAIKKITDDFNDFVGGDLSELQALRVIDEIGAKKFGVENTNVFEKKIVEWAAKPEGKAYLQAKMKAAELEKNIPDLPADSKGFDVMPVDEARAMQQRAERWTPEQKQSLTTYTGGTYKEWNARLRRGDRPTPSMQRAIDGMRPTDRQFLVHRGTGYKQFHVNSYEELLALTGETVADKAFLSTSVGGSAAFSGEVRMTIEVVQGTKGAFVKDISNFSHENEFVIAPGTKMKILQVKKHGYVTEVRLRVVL